MSNPGVIMLASLNGNEHISFPYRFVIEDNIGEAIHIHYKDIRIDLTIKEFLQIADIMEQIISELIEIPGFCLDEFDPVHLMGYIPELAYIREIVPSKIMLSQLIVDSYSNEGEPVYVPLRESRVFKALNGMTQEDDARAQINYLSAELQLDQSNAARLQYCMKKIEHEGYPFQNQYILIDENHVIIDGQHRAACLYYAHGDISVPVHQVVKYKKSAEPVPIATCHMERENRRLSKVKCLLKKILWRTWQSQERGEQILSERLDDQRKKLEQLEKEVSDLNGLQQEFEKLRNTINRVMYR